MGTREQVADWVSAYEKAWRSPGIGSVEALFTTDASYSQGPYREPVIGLPAIAEMWEAERDGPDEVFTVTSEVVAADGDIGVARLLVRYGDPVHQEYKDLWVMRFAGDGRCQAFEEWPFEPES
jgi:ketosteroid isomerase-like protein